MATLTGGQIKDTYTGLIKTTDNAGITGSLKRITDGAGASTGIQLSSAKLRADALEINTVVENNSRTKLLNWDASDGVVGFYSFSTADPAVSASISSDDVTITTGTNAANNFTLVSGTNVTMSLTGTDVTISATGGLDDLFARNLGQGVDASYTVATSEAGQTFTLGASSGTTTTITLPDAADGLSFEFKVISEGTYFIDCASGDGFKGAIALTNNGVRGSLSDGSDTKLPYTMFQVAAVGDNRININGLVTSGNHIGGYIRVVATSSSVWQVEGHLFNEIDYAFYATVNGMPSTTPDILTTQP
jgi:hypothetical protein